MSQIQKDEKKNLRDCLSPPEHHLNPSWGKKKKVNLRFKKSEGKKIHPSIPLASHNS